MEVIILVALMIIAFAFDASEVPRALSFQNLLDSSYGITPAHPWGSFLIGCILGFAYFIGTASLFRFGIFRKRIPLAWSIPILLVMLLGWFTLMASMGAAKYRPSFFLILCFIAAFRVTRWKLERHVAAPSPIPNGTPDSKPEGERSIPSDSKLSMLKILGKVFGCFILSAVVIIGACVGIDLLGGESSDVNEVFSSACLIIISLAAGVALFHAIRLTVKALCSKGTSAASFWGKPFFLLFLSVSLIVAAVQIEDVFVIPFDDEILIVLGVAAFLTAFFLWLFSPKSNPASARS